MPQRIQLRRTKGWRKPPGAIVVSRPSRWGNPFSFRGEVGGRTRAVLLFRRLLLEKRELGHLAEYLDGLAGHDLCCWCPLDQPCHADVLLELANGDAG